MNLMIIDGKQDDGSSLDAFLAGETWDQYLLRMGRDGEWGDHMILNAIAEVLQMEIVIYGGIADQRKTTIVPKSCSQIKGDVRIAHLLESHYVSLRRKDWFKELESQHEQQHVDLDGSTKGNGIFPISHLDVMLKIIIQSGYLQSLNSSLVHFFKPPYNSWEDAAIHIVGDFISEAIPTAYSGTAFQSLSLTYLSSHTGHQFKEKNMPILYIPHDTKAVFDNEKTSRKDLVVCGDPSGGPVKLKPVQPSLWKWRLEKTHSTVYLKTFELSVDVLHDEIKTIILKVSKYAGLTSKCIIAFSCEWPTFAVEWISRSRPGLFPMPDMVQTIFSAGCHFVPYISQSEYCEIIDDVPTESVGDAQTIWCLSFSVAERTLLRALSTEQRACFLVFREIVEEALSQYRLSSSVVKSIFLYACENIPTKDWASKSGECLLILLNNTSKAFGAGYLAHYFICTKNLLSGLSESVLREYASELQKCLSRPIAALNHALETLNIASSDIGPVLDQIIDDVDDFVARGNAGQSFIGCVYPCWGYLIQLMIMNSEYTKALSALQDMQAELENIFAKQISLEQVAVSVLTGPNICKQWVFALYIDLSLGTKVSSALCHDREGIHISEVFGPKATELLVDTCIPKGANIEYGNLTFAESVSQMLQELKRDDAFIAVLKYYLETYAVFAGDDIVLPVQDETAKDDIITAFSTGMSKVVGSKEAVAEYQLSTALPMCLSNLHVSLFNKCMQIQKQEEYRPLLPTYQSLAKLGFSKFVSRNATRMVQNLSAATLSETMFPELMISGSLEPDEEYGTDDGVRFQCTVM